MLMTVQPFFFASSYSACVNVPTLVSGQSLSGTVRILSLCIVVQYEHRDPRAVARFGVFEHLLVAGRIAERGERPAPNHQMDAFGLPGFVVVQQQLRFFRQERFAALIIMMKRAT